MTSLPLACAVHERLSTNAVVDFRLQMSSRIPPSGRVERVGRLCGLDAGNDRRRRGMQAAARSDRPGASWRCGGGGGRGATRRHLYRPEVVAEGYRHRAAGIAGRRRRGVDACGKAASRAVIWPTKRPGLWPLARRIARSGAKRAAADRVGPAASHNKVQNAAPRGSLATPLDEGSGRRERPCRPSHGKRGRSRCQSRRQRGLGLIGPSAWFRPRRPAPESRDL